MPLTARSRSAFLLTSAAAFVVYALTIAPDLTWSYGGGDGGELIAAAATLGVPHPPGYPSYVLLGHLVGRLPLQPLPLRFNLFSAVASALAAGLVAAAAASWLASVRSSGPGARSLRPLPAVAAGLTVAFTPLFWSRALITEVYALNSLAVAAVLWSLLPPGRGRSPWIAGLCLGLAVTTHPTSWLLAPLALVLTPRKAWPRLGAGAILGLLPLAALPLLAQSDGPVVWGEPTTLAGWWWLVSARLYRPLVMSAPFGPRLRPWTTAALRQLAWVGWLLLLLGRPPRGRAVLALAGTAAAYGAFALGYNTPDAASLALPALLPVGLLLAFALHRLGPGAVVLPLLLLGLNFGALSLRGEREVRPLGEAALDAAPPAAILVTNGDPTVFTLWALHAVEGARPDVTIVDERLFAFDWYRRRMARREPGLAVPADDDLGALLAATRRPVCFVDLAAPAPGSNPDAPRITCG